MESVVKSFDFTSKTFQKKLNQHLFWMISLWNVVWNQMNILVLLSLQIAINLNSFSFLYPVLSKKDNVWNSLRSMHWKYFKVGFCTSLTVIQPLETIIWFEHPIYFELVKKTYSNNWNLTSFASLPNAIYKSIKLLKFCPLQLNSLTADVREGGGEGGLGFACLQINLTQKWAHKSNEFRIFINFPKSWLIHNLLWKH